MKNFIPKEKMSKKAQKQLAAERRAVWTIPPVSRRIESKKLYNRKRSRAGDRDYGMGSLRLCLVGDHVLCGA